MLDGAVAATPRVLIVPSLDMEQVVKNPRWPAAFLLDLGGELENQNGKIWRRVLGVTVMTAEPRDGFGEKAMREVIRLGELMVAELELSTSDSAIFLLGDTDTEAVTSTNGQIFVHKTWNFVYRIERT